MRSGDCNENKLLIYQEVINHDLQRSPRESRTNIGPYCKACPVCNGRACGNACPGPGSKNPGNGAARNYDAWQRVYVNMDTICDHDVPTTGLTLFGREFGLPVFTATDSALPMHYSDALRRLRLQRHPHPLGGRKRLHELHGDGVDPEIMKRAVARDEQGRRRGVPRLSPGTSRPSWRSSTSSTRTISSPPPWTSTARASPPQGHEPQRRQQDRRELREIISYARMPFIIKGIMPVRGAGEGRRGRREGHKSSPTTAAACWARPAPPPTSCPRLRRPSRGSASSWSTAASAPAWTSSRPSPLARTAVLIGRPFVPAVYGGEAEGREAALRQYKAGAHRHHDPCAERRSSPTSAADMVVSGEVTRPRSAARGARIRPPRPCGRGGFLSAGAGGVRARNNGGHRPSARAAMPSPSAASTAAGTGIIMRRPISRPRALYKLRSICTSTSSKTPALSRRTSSSAGIRLSVCHRESLEHSDNPISQAMLDYLGGYAQYKRLILPTQAMLERAQAGLL